MAEHAWINDNVSAYVLGGLSADERARLDRHVSGCRECAHTLAENRQLDQTLDRLFVEVRPAPGLEGRMIEGLRNALRPRRPISRFVRAAAAAAAVLLLGLVGLAVHSLANEGQNEFHDRSYFGISRSKKGPDLGRDIYVVLDDSHSMNYLDDYHRPALELRNGKISGGEDREIVKESYGNDKAYNTDATINDRLKNLDGIRSDLETYSDSKGKSKEMGKDKDKSELNEKNLGGSNLPPVNSEKPTPRPGQVEHSPSKKLPATESGIIKPNLPLPSPLPDPKGLSRPDYFGFRGDKKEGKPIFKDSESDPGKSPPSEKKPVPQGKKPLDEEGTKRGDNAENGESKKEPKIPPIADPAPAARKIIRTGELEFEIDQFDPAVAAVTRLVNAIPGAFIATINSDKLANGKVRGSVVVRMPPEKLDKFLLDIRQELGKVGELKNQRIGSQDVSKKYYDVESRLRAGRTMEDRLLTIIKTGKGEIKDLLSVERELGEWRNKIEEMEGEIRYYNNQISLSTLTISLAEKEIRTAAAMVVSERVNLRIETEDVEKALQAALTAVTEAKGRVTRSDLKQHAGGQYEAVLHFEVLPAAAGPVRAKLKGLGHVAHHEADRLQQAEGGTVTSGDIKLRTNDVQFQVILLNLANIQPRDAYHLQIAAQDVQAEYRKLQDAVALAKGQIRVGQLDEQDKLNVGAQIDFDIPKGQKETIDKLLADVGDVQGRNTKRASPTESSTDTKVGYRITLKNFSSLAPRDTAVLHAVSLDVASAFRKLQDAVATAKGQVRAANLNEQEKLNISAQFDFDVPVAARETIEKLLVEVGEVFSRTLTRVAPGETATDRKAGYRLTLKNVAGMPPRESVKLGMKVENVEQAASALKDKVKANAGTVVTEKSTQEASGLITTVLLFDVPLSAKDDLIRQFKGVGVVQVSQTRNNVQVPDTKLAIAHLDVTLASSTPIVPNDEGLWPQIRNGLSYSAKILSFSLMFIILGLSVVLPWALVIWVALKIVRKVWKKSPPPVTV